MKKQFYHGYLVLLYESKFFKHPSKLRMHWLGPYMITYVIEGCAVQLQKLNGKPLGGLVNGI